MLYVDMLYMDILYGHVIWTYFMDILYVDILYGQLSSVSRETKCIKKLCLQSITIERNGVLEKFI